MKTTDCALQFIDMQMKIIVVANRYDTPGKLDEICAIAEKHGAIIIEAASESLGATYKCRQIGTSGAYNAISLVGVMNVADNLCRKVA